MSDQPKESKVEIAKRQSNYLRGRIAETLQSDQPSFDHDDVHLLKFHGTYEQEDRDARQASKATGGDKEYWFMVRTRIPGGGLTAEQYLAMDELADRYTYNRSLRITVRQAFQFHGVLKGNLKATIAAINQSMLTTLAACGDVERNVMAPPAPLADEAHRAVRALAGQIARQLAPTTRAYHEIWLDAEKMITTEPQEPLYGDVYLPRKFKTGIALPEDNSIDVHSQDLGLIAILADGQVKGVDVLVGGGFGMTHRKSDTFARLASPLGYVDAAHVIETVQVVAGIFRDHGNRADRTNARLKYVVEKWGMDKFREEFRERAGFELRPWVDVGPLQHRDYLGVTPQGDGRFCYGVFVENGRVIDSERVRIKTALRKLVQTLKPGVILTPGQNILFTDLSEKDVQRAEAILKAYGVPSVQELTAVRRHALACPALPTCGLALAESERVFPGIVDELEEELGRFGLQDEPITVRMTGCPNGCVRPYTADIAFVGRKMGVYDIYVGGRLPGDRLVDFYAENVPREGLIQALQPLIEAWAHRRQPEEPLGDFYQRVYGTGTPKHILTGAKDHPARQRIVPAEPPK